MTAEDSSSKESREKEGGEKTQMAGFTLATTITYLVIIVRKYSLLLSN